MSLMRIHIARLRLTREGLSPSHPLAEIVNRIMFNAFRNSRGIDE